MTSDPVRELMLDAFDRIREGVPDVVDGLSVDELLWRPDRDANHIAWLVWHLARQQDDQVAHLVGGESAWLADGWADRFALPYAPDTHGWSMSSADVGRFTVADPGHFAGYQAAVHARHRGSPRAPRRGRLRPRRRPEVGPTRHGRHPPRLGARRRGEAPRPGGVRPGSRRAPARLTVTE